MKEDWKEEDKERERARLETPQVEKSEENSEMALIKLSEVFGQSTTQITRRYLGLKTEEILSAYDLLSF